MDGVINLHHIYEMAKTQKRKMRRSKLVKKPGEVLRRRLSKCLPSMHGQKHFIHGRIQLASPPPSEKSE